MLNRLKSVVQNTFTPENIAPLSLQQIWQEPKLTPEEIANFCEVIDRQSPITVIGFSGLALGFAGLPSYEFRKSLGSMGDVCNIILIRDVRRYWYHLTPEGDIGGLDFYTQYLQSQLQALKTKYLITTGVSAGGFAALFFGWKLGADQILAFSPQTDLISYYKFNPLSLLKYRYTRKDLQSFLKEVLMVAIALRRRTRLLRRKLPLTQWGRLDAAQRINERTQSSVYYCQDNALDTQETLKISALPGITLHACPCNQHNVAGYLRSSEELVKIFQTALESATYKHICG